MTLEEIRSASIDVVEKRMQEIRGIDIDEADNINELNAEVDALLKRKKELKDKEDSKNELRNKINNGSVPSTPIKKPQEERKMEITKENYLSSQEYRNGFLKKLQGKDLTEEERAAIALSEADAVIPENMQSSILTKAKEYAPILNEITLLNVNGNVKFAVEGTVNEAKGHTENAKIDPDSDTLTEVSLSVYEIVKMIQISASVKSMSIPAFETWLVDTIAEALAMKIEKIIFQGTGSNEGKGIDKITWTADTNAVEVENASNTTANDIFKLFGLLKDGYARNAKVYCSRKTLFTDLLNLQDKSKNDLVVKEGSNYYLLGTLVEFTASIALHELILGDPKKYVANMPESMTVKNAYDIDTNSYKYLGVAEFDGKPAIEEAFVKLVKKVE